MQERLDALVKWGLHGNAESHERVEGPCLLFALSADDDSLLNSYNNNLRVEYYTCEDSIYNGRMGWEVFLYN